MASGRKQFVLIGIAAALFATIMIIGVAGNAVRGNLLVIPLAVGALLLAVGAIWLGIWLNQRRIQIMFRNSTPDRLIENYHANLLQARARKMPHADAAAAHLSALAATVYGQFDRAREELAAVDWSETPAMYQGHRLQVLALIALLEKHDSAEALRLAGEARKLVPSGTAPVLHSAILVAAGDCDSQTIQATERAARRNTGALPAICAWALSLHFERAGNTAEASRYRDRVRDAAPYFVGLRSQPS